MFEQSIDFFVLFVYDHRFWGYTILFIAMVFEGETFLLAAGMLATLDAFDVGDVWVISFSAVVMGNTMWYYVGSSLNDREFTRGTIKWAKNAITFFLPRFNEKPFKSIFFSKFIYGANRATVIMSGVFHVPFDIFFRAEFLASILWVTLYEGVGYFFGEVALSTTRSASRLALIATAFVVAFISIQRLITHQYERYERKQLANQEKNSRNT